MSTLARAIVIAAEAHAEAKDKAGAPYILHPLRVMLKMTDDASRIVAVLHDVVEDTQWTLAELRRAGFSEGVLSGIDAVTIRDGEEYGDFVRRAAADPIGRRVKLADLEDNCDLSRIADPTERDFERIKKYERAVAALREDPLEVRDGLSPDLEDP